MKHVVFGTDPVGRPLVGALDHERDAIEGRLPGPQSAPEALANKE